jgi:hypothetical protein
MQQPEGFLIPGKEEMVCQLQTPIDWNKLQTGGMWSLRSSSSILALRSKHDFCVYYRVRPDGEHTILIIYVDDGLVCSNRAQVLNEI